MDRRTFITSVAFGFFGRRGRCIGLVISRAARPPVADIPLRRSGKGCASSGGLKGRTSSSTIVLRRAGWTPCPTSRPSWSGSRSTSSAAPSAPAAAAKNATGTIPIVMIGAGADPVGQGLIASLARPGGNVTGLSYSVGQEIFGKQLALLKEALPKASRVAALWHPGAYGERTMTDMLNETEAAARTLGVHLRLVAVRGPR